MPHAYFPANGRYVLITEPPAVGENFEKLLFLVEFEALFLQWPKFYEGERPLPTLAEPQIFLTI
jgi:hypothetical protein